MSRLGRPDAVIVGGGLAGLCCALRLHRAGLRGVVLEASDDVGGRVRTDRVDGFLLDRGFQVFLTAYPEARDVLDYASLDLRLFQPGALVRRNGRFERLGDPTRRARDLPQTLFARIGSLPDKLRVLRLRHRVSRMPLESLFAAPPTTAREALSAEGFSEDMIDGFFRPLFGGVFLERDLSTSSRMLHFVFRMFAHGDTALPAPGMGAIPRQIAEALPPWSIQTHTRVDAVERDRVVLENGEEIRARSVVVATEGPAAARLLDEPPPPAGRSVTCFYFAAETPPVKDPVVVLDGDGAGPVNDLCVVSAVAPTYAPAGQALVSASVPDRIDADPSDLLAEVRDQLAGWFGPDASTWRHLRTYPIRHALPDQSPAALDPVQRSVRHPRGIYVCGDHRETGSMQGAMVSGRRAATAILEDREE